MGDVFLGIISQWNQYISTFWDTTQVVDIVGPTGEKEWISFKGKDLVGEYALQMDVDSGFPLTRQAKMQMATSLFNMFNGDQFTDQELLRRQVIDAMAAINPPAEMIMKPAQNPNPPTSEMMMNGAKQVPMAPVSGTSPDSPAPLDSLG
jgi:hypothetical protein